MSELKVEMLKVIAEGMGYTVRLSELNEICTSGDGVFIERGKVLNTTYYNPLTNNDQMVEIMEKLIHECIYHIRGGANPNDVHIRDKDYALVAKGKTINEAVCNAAYEYFKDK